MLRRALVMTPGADGARAIRAEDLGLRAEETVAPRSRADFAEEDAQRIRLALHRSGWNVSEAARRLQMPRNTLYRRMKKFGIR